MKQLIGPGIGARSQGVWDALRERKRLHWAEQYRKGGAKAALELAGDLRDHMQLLRPDWPSPNDREKDLANHAKMRAIFDRCAHALAFHTHRGASR